MITDKLFIGTEIEGPIQGERTLFIPRTAFCNMHTIEGLYHENSGNLHRFYFGAGNQRGVTWQHIELIYALKEKWPDCTILIEGTVADLCAAKRMFRDSFFKMVTFILVFEIPHSMGVDLSDIVDIKILANNAVYWYNASPIVTDMNDPYYSSDHLI